MRIYTDGGCSPNPGPGGWGVYIEDKELEIFGSYESTTNNQMELMAVIEALKHIQEEKWMNEPLCMYVDSTYVLNGIKSWLSKWKQNNWMTTSRKPVSNQLLWKELDLLIRQYPSQIEWKWVKGHAGIKGNEIADKLVKEAIKNIKNN